MYNFVTDKEANKQINEVYNLVKQGQSDLQIAQSFNDKKTVNLQDPTKEWDVEQISTIRKTFELDTDPPKTLKEPSLSNQEKRPSKILIVLSVLIVLILAFLNFSTGLMQNLEAGRLIGRTLGVLLVPLMVVGFFQIGKGFRNNSSRVKIFFWTAFVMLIIKALSISSALNQNMTSKRADVPELRISVDQSRAEELKKSIVEVKAKTKRETENLAPLEEVTLKAEAGDANAQEDLGKRYLNGMGVKIDKQKAYDWYYKAAEQGNARAQYWVGDMEAFDVKDLTDEERKERVMKWFLKAANGCDRSAQNGIAYIYETGKIGRSTELPAIVDTETAMQWYEKAALNTHGGSMARLGLLLAEAPGASEENKIQGLAWSHVGDAIYGKGGAYDDRFKAISEQMTKEQIVQSERVAQTLLEKVKNHKCLPTTG